MFISIKNTQIEANIEEAALNFNNEASIEQRELAKEDLISAKVLRDSSKKIESSSKEAVRTIKAVNKKSIQCALESVEKAQKAVTYADESGKITEDKKLHERLETTHNSSWVQREHQKAGVNLLDGDDIKKLNATVKRKAGEKSPYNAVRFSQQNIGDEDVDFAIEIAEKAVNKLDSMIKEQDLVTIDLGDGYQVRVEL